jgi:hypothetical protein
MRPFPFDEQTEAFYAGPEWQERTGVAQLAQVLFRKAEDRFVMLAFNGDGSGEHGRGPFVVAGYLGDTWDWFELERDWEKELKKNPSIRHFHACDSILRQRDGRKDFGGEFAGWTTDSVHRKCTNLAQAMVKHSDRFVAISSTLNWDMYHAVIGDDVFRKVFWTPYLIAVHGAIDLTLKRSNEQFKLHRGRVAFMFDTEGDQLDADTAQHYRLSPSNFPFDMAARVGSISFDSDTKFPMLQPADFLAWSVRAKLAGEDSPWYDTIFKNWQGGSHEAKIRSTRLKQVVTDTEVEFHKTFPDWKAQQDAAKAAGINKK